jgi:predicted Zn-dependent protease
MMQRTLVISGIALLVFAGGGIGGCSTNPATGESQLILVSAEETTKMGVEAKPELIKEYGGEVQSPELRRYIDQVGRRLVRHVEPEYKDTRWEFVTLDSDVINAFALPGGKVFMSRGLLQQLDNEAAVAGVLGHEIGHVTARHVDERISQSMALDLGLQLGSGLTDSQIALAAGQLFGQGYLLKFGRDQESQADELGLKYMVKAGYDPMGIADVMRVLIAASEGNRQWEMLSTHPDPQRRLDEIMEQINSDYPNTKGNPEYRKFENRFERDAAPYLPKRSSEARLGVMPPPALWCAHCRIEASAEARAESVSPTP